MQRYAGGISKTLYTNSSTARLMVRCGTGEVMMEMRLR